MFIRCAFFKGQVKPGMEEAFDQHVHQKLVPCGPAFPARSKCACCASSKAT
ncbi:hypothetical protein ACSFBM_12575 [Variovorax sp. GB1R11]|uniref:hypothetical protein n=1 Tax=Variovorax sp. GB1R11 TaxID=3443741 RepID=UPI003F471EC7